MLALIVVAPFVAYPFFVMQMLCFALFACAFNLLDRLRRPAVVRPRDVSRHGELRQRARREGLGPRSGTRHSLRRRERGGARAGHGRARDPQPGHLFRDDHGRAVADDLFLLRRGAVHPRRGRHPVGAAGLRLRPDRPVEAVAALYVRRGDFPVRVLHRLSHDQFAVRRDSQGDPRERAARDLARLSRRPLQARRVRPLGCARRARRRDQGDRGAERLADRRQLLRRRAKSC